MDSLNSLSPWEVVALMGLAAGFIVTVAFGLRALFRLPPADNYASPQIRPNGRRGGGSR